MELDTLNYIVGLDLALFSIICSSSGSLVKKAWAQKLYSRIDHGVRGHDNITKLKDVLKRIVEDALSPLTVVSDGRVILFIVSLLTFSMALSQFISSYILKVVEPTTTDHILFTFAFCFGLLYFTSAIIFLFVQNTWEAIYSHVTLGGIHKNNLDD